MEPTELLQELPLNQKNSQLPINNLHTQWRKSWGGQGGTVPSKVLTGGTAVLTVPPKVQASEGHCWVLLPEISKRVYHIL